MKLQQDKKRALSELAFQSFISSYLLPASLYSAAIYLRVFSAGPFVSTSDAASELSGL